MYLVLVAVYKMLSKPDVRVLQVGMMFVLLLVVSRIYCLVSDRKQMYVCDSFGNPEVGFVSYGKTVCQISRDDWAETDGLLSVGGKTVLMLDSDKPGIRLNVLMQGGGPEIRSKTYRVFHKHNNNVVIDETILWLKDSLKLLGCTPATPAIGIGRTHYEASHLMLKAMVYGNLNNQSETEQYITKQLNQSQIGPMGLKGATTVLGTFLNIGPQRASGVRIVSARPCCFVEPRKWTVKI